MQQRQTHKKNKGSQGSNGSSGSLMIEEDGLDDYEESDSLLNERPKSTTSQQNFINWSALLNGVPVQHLKILSLIGVLLTVATVFNVATAGYSLNHQKMLVELQSGRSTAYDTANVNDHTMLQQAVQPTDLQQLKKLRASSLNQDNTGEFQTSTSNAANTKSLEEELFSAAPTESNSLSESATEEESQKIRDERMEQDKTESKTKVSTRTKVDDGSDASTNIDTLSAVELGESSPEWNPQNSDNQELSLQSENAAKKKSQKSSTDDSLPTELPSPLPTSNVDVEITSSLQQQTSMIQKLQTQLEQQQEMMKQFRQQQLEMKKTAPDTGNSAGYSFPGGETLSTYALPPQEQNPAYYRQPIIPAPPGGGWVPQQQQPNLQPGTTQNTQYTNYQQTAAPGGWVPQQQQGVATAYPPQQPAIPSGSMYVPLQQQQGDEPMAMLPTGNVMLPTGGIVANTQTQQYQQQADSAMEYSPEAQSASTAQAPLLTDPGDLSGYKDAWDPHEATDTPVFWHVPKAGGSTVKDIMGTCHRMTMASEAGIADGHGEDTTIAVVKIGGDPEKGQDPSPFVNVDATTIAGLERAKKLGLAQSGLADAIVTTYVYEANGLFDPQHRGRLFSVFRHPVDRAISMFQYLQYADWEPTYNPQLASMSIEEYAQSGMVENNWLTRTLANKSDDAELTDNDVNIAMDIVRRKFLIGLLSKKEETMERFEKYFGWKYHINPTNQEKCRVRLLGSGANANTAHKKEKPGPGTPAYDLLANENLYDLQLYEYVETLFVEQAAFVEGIPDGYRMEGATCCKCGEKPTC